jgi:hypothetical protein
MVRHGIACGIFLALSACGSPYQVADPARPPTQTAREAILECFRSSGIGMLAIGAPFGAIGGLVAGAAAGGGSAAQVNQCMRDKGFLVLRE